MFHTTIYIYIPRANGISNSLNPLFSLLFLPVKHKILKEYWVQGDFGIRSTPGIRRNFKWVMEKHTVNLLHSPVTTHTCFTPPFFFFFFWPCRVHVVKNPGIR